MRAMKELMPEGREEDSVIAAHLVPTVDNGGHGRVMVDEARRNAGMYVPIFGDFAGIVSWLVGEWDSDNTFADVTKRGAKMDLLYAERITGERLLPEVMARIRKIETKIVSGEYERPKDWILFVSNMINLSKLLDGTLISHGKLSLKNASAQNLIGYAAMLDSGVKKTVDADGALVEATLDRERNFANTLFDAFGIKGVKLQFQTYDQACIVALLEGCVLKIGEDALMLRRKGNKVIATLVKKDAAGSLTTTPLEDTEMTKSVSAGQMEFTLNGKTIVITKGRVENSIEVTIDEERIILRESKEGETTITVGEEKHYASSDASWTTILVGGSDIDIMGRRIEGQFAIAMEEHLSRIDKVSLKKMAPKTDGSNNIVYDEGKGWITYDVSDVNAEIRPTVWARDFIRKTQKTIRFDSGGALTTQVAALLNRGIVQELVKRKDIPKVYIPPLTRDVIVSGLSLKDIIRVMEDSMREATGEEDISFEHLFSHIVVPEVPKTIQDEYLKCMKAKSEGYLNESGLSAMQDVTTLEEIRNILSVRENLNKEIAYSIYDEDPAKAKAKMKKMLPAPLLSVTQEDLDYIEQKGISVINVSDKKFFGIWENKIVYEPKNMRDLIISLGNVKPQNAPVELEVPVDERVEKDMNTLHRLNMDLIPPVEEGKILWHVIPIDLVPESIRSEFVSTINKIDRDYPDLREKIKVVTDRQVLHQVVSELADDSNNVVGVAVKDVDSLKWLPEGVKALVFEGELGDFRHLEGVLAALRALQNNNARALIEIYRILTGSAFLGYTADDILAKINDPEKLADIITFGLTPVEIPDDDYLTELNGRLLEFIYAA